MSDDRFLGTWRLLSCELRSSNGEVSYPMGEDAIGYIAYHKDGHMSVAFMSADREAFTADDILGGTPSEKARAAETYVSYAGTYAVSGNQVKHHIKVSLFPNWTGQTQIRNFRFEEDRLFLSTPPMLVQGKMQEAYLIWQKVDDA